MLLSNALQRPVAIAVVRYEANDCNSPHVHTVGPESAGAQIIHQFVPDEMNASGAYWYPDTSRAINSWRVPGWEYRHYHPEDMEPFLATHFPKEVVQTYQSLSTAFPSLRLDLFRYCLLLIHGGLFVNADVLLESNLDLILDADVGFMVATDDRVSFNRLSLYRTCMECSFFPAT
jgi:hypothetical protein